MADTKWADYINRPLTDDEKKWCHEWSLDYQVEENERLFPTNKDADYPRESVDTAQILADAGVEHTPPLVEPSAVGQRAMYSGPVVVEGENDVPPAPGELATRVPMPRDHPLTGLVEDAAAESVTAESVTVDDDKWDGRAVRVEVNSLNVDDLKVNLRDLEEPVSGTKDELRDRLVKALKKAHDEEQKA